MQEPPPIEQTAIPPALPPVIKPARGIWLEVIVVLFIGVIPDLWTVVSSYFSPRSGSWSFLGLMLFIGFRSLRVTIPVLYLIHRSGELWSFFGFGSLSLRKDLSRSILVFGGTYMAYIAANYLLYAGFQSASAFRSGETFFPVPRTTLDYALLILVSAANGFAEELVMRGYLIPRFEQLLGSTAKAILLSSFLFGAYHLYQGWWNATVIFFGGIVYGLFFCRYRSIWPLAIAHAITDIVSFSLLPND